MSYSTYDFEESLGRAQGEFGFGLPDVAEVIAAWGGSPEGGCSWEGGFVMRLKDGRFAYLTGWCDYTGWGCQDGIACEFFPLMPAWQAFKKTEGLDEGGETYGWDTAPNDLNRIVRGEAPRTMDDAV